MELRSKLRLFSDYLRTQIIYQGRRSLAFNYQLSDQADLREGFSNVLKMIYRIIAKFGHHPHVVVFKYSCILFDENNEARLFTASNNTKFYKIHNISKRKIRDIENDATILSDSVDVACNEWFLNSAYTFGMVTSVQVDLVFE